VVVFAAVDGDTIDAEVGLAFELEDDDLLDAHAAMNTNTKATLARTRRVTLHSRAAPAKAQPRIWV
jgi:hypothetical protein